MGERDGVEVGGEGGRGAPGATVASSGAADIGDAAGPAEGELDGSVDHGVELGAGGESTLEVAQRMRTDLMVAEREACAVIADLMGAPDVATKIRERDPSWKAPRGSVTAAAQGMRAAMVAAAGFAGYQAARDVGRLWPLSCGFKEGSPEAVRWWEGVMQWAKEQRRSAAASEARARAMADPVFAEGFRATTEAGEKIGGGTWPENPHAAGSAEAARWALGAEQARLEGASPDSWRDGGAGMDEGVMRDVADEERGGHLELVHRIERLSDELRMLRARDRMGVASEAVERDAAALRLIEARWASMLRAPGTWGSLESLELQALLLFELRAALEGGAWEDVRRRHAALVRAGFQEAPARLASHAGASEERLLALLIDLEKGGRVAARGENGARVQTWHALECACGSSVVADVRVNGGPRGDLVMSCPICRAPMRLTATWPADLAGYGSRGGTRVAPRDEFAVGWWYAIGRCYEGVREVLGGRANINAPPVQRVIGPVLCQTEAERDDALSTRLLDMPLDTRVVFRGPFGTEEFARAAMLADGVDAMEGERWPGAQASVRVARWLGAVQRCLAATTQEELHAATLDADYAWTQARKALPVRLRDEVERLGAGK